MDDLHRISQILIERETIDKDQFERLVEGDAEADVFAEIDAKAKAAGTEAPTPERRPQPKPRPFPLPGSAATMKPPEPEGVN
jgi:cell division protease FtsH